MTAKPCLVHNPLMWVLTLLPGSVVLRLTGKPHVVHVELPHWTQIGAQVVVSIAQSESD